MNILISGGNGFLGSSLAVKFVEHGFNVFVLLRENSNFVRLDTIKDQINFIIFSSEEDLNFKLNDICPDVLINTACNYGRKGESLLQVFDSNYRLGLLLLNHFCRKKNEILFLNVGTTLDDETNLYSFSKSQFAKLGKFVSSKYSHILFKNLLLQHMYGPGDDDSKFASNVLNSCLSNVPELDLTGGNQTRDFIYINDVTDAIVVLIANIEKCVSNEIEIGSGNLIKIKDFVLTIKELTKSHIRLNFGSIPYRGDESNFKAADLKILNSLGWAPKYSLIEGLMETINMQLK